MTTSVQFERMVESWLETAGPVDIASDVVEAALGAARRTGQRRGPVAWLVGPSPWPATGAIHAFPVPVRLAILAAVILAALAVATIAGGRPAPTPIVTGAISPVANMAVARAAAVTVVLHDGRVLVAGGVEATPKEKAAAPAEIFDPSTQAFTMVRGSVLAGRGDGRLLPNDTVLLVLFDQNAAHAYAQVLDPASGVTVDVATVTPDLERPALATLLDGRILLAGGRSNQDRVAPFVTVRAAAEIFDPATGTFHATGSMHLPRWGHSATTLEDGRVLVVGGDGRTDAELYDPQTGTFAPTGSPAIVHDTNVAVRLIDGRVLVAHSRGQESSDEPTPTEIYEPATGLFAPSAALPHIPSTMTLLPDGRVFVTGTLNKTEDEVRPVLPWATIYDPASGAMAAVPALRSPGETPALLHDGGVLLVGGGVHAVTREGSYLDNVRSAEVFR